MRRVARSKGGRAFLWVLLSPAAAVGLLMSTPARPQQFDSKLFAALRWRLIGPFRAGRVTAVAGVPGEPAIYYMGTPGGGIWKTSDGGEAWKPIFDQEHVASIGALAVAPSDPNTVYVGTGEQTPGNGVYKSTDGGATWTNVGLRETHYIQAILVDPRDPNLVIVGAAGDFTAGAERGVFKTRDGGQHWTKVLYKDDSTGVADLSMDPNNHRVLYASLWRRTFRPQPGTQPPRLYSGLFKSRDEGSTWKPAGSQGLPSEDLGRVGIVAAPGNHGRRLYAILRQGFYRSDDAGATWQRATTDPRVIGNPYFSRVFADPQNPDVVYVAQTSLYRSTDGGHTFESYVGAPSGDDFHVLWIDPQNSQRMILGVDQGATISLDGGRTWSSWYNQPTGQFYHVSTDNAFPYRVYAAQQDSGTAAVASRSDYGEISDRDWYPVGGFEAAYIAADPANPNLVYSGGWYGSILRFDRTTGQFATVFVGSNLAGSNSKYRTAGMAPLAFSPQDPHILYLGTQFVLKTTDGGMSWQEISPDITEKPKSAESKPASAGAAGPPRFDAVSTLSPSPAQAGELWAGTSNGNIELTRDGGATWHNVSPAGAPEPGSVRVVEASHHDAATAYAVLGAGFSRKPEPYIARTHDYGHTWQKIVLGLPASEAVRVVREDPVRKGLLYAGTTSGVFVSFDDGDHWQSLQLNLPTATVTDLAVHEDDLAASTFGRALWILDDLTPLRQMDAEVLASDAHLFRPAIARRVRWDNNQDTPLPPETPAGQNPPDGAILNYYLRSAPAEEVSLGIYDEDGKAVRRFSSAPAAEDAKTPPANVPSYWFEPPEVLPKNAGTNRFVWDLRYPPPHALPFSYYGQLLDYTEYTLADHAIPGATPRQQPQGPLVVPGSYVAELKVGGQTYRQPLVVKLDPREQASATDLAQQLNLEKKIGGGLSASSDAFHQVAALRSALGEREKTLTDAAKAKEVNTAAQALEKKIDAAADSFGRVNRDLARLATALESADVRPSETARAAVEGSCKDLDAALTRWRELNAKDLAAFNATLAQHRVAQLPIAPPTAAACD